jgi:phage-related protein
VTWTVTFHSARVESEVFDLPAGFVARFIRYAERMEVYGPDLGMPHTRAMGDGLFELRIKAMEGIARVFYCTVVHGASCSFTSSSRKAIAHRPMTSALRGNE